MTLADSVNQSPAQLLLLYKTIHKFCNAMSELVALFELKLNIWKQQNLKPTLNVPLVWRK